MFRIVRHWKGGLYTVVGEATHTETGEQLVIYANAAGDLYARPSKSFHGIIEDNGTKPRFVPYREGSK